MGGGGREGEKLDQESGRGPAFKAGLPPGRSVPHRHVMIKIVTLIWGDGTSCSGRRWKAVCPADDRRGEMCQRRF